MCILSFSDLPWTVDWFGLQGMQRNPGVNTIEEELLNALLKAKLISQQNFDEPQSMAFQVG
jgi:tRNA U38,U39,U40 pseudouridine synthase TruA